LTLIYEAYNFMIKRIISGGQTGADRAALDCAIALDIEHGGWCPKGRSSEDGVIDQRYKLREMPNSNYRKRTRQNVIDSDATLILNLGDLDGGTLKTQEFAIQHGKPFLVVQLDDCANGDPLETALIWLRDHTPHVLNVAGPRESKRPGSYQMSYDFLFSMWAR
jgi:hypothetical protein